MAKRIKIKRLAAKIDKVIIKTFPAIVTYNKNNLQELIVVEQKINKAVELLTLLDEAIKTVIENYKE